ncbi:peptidoglycan editing factor PgeF [Polynucleobacter sp. MWH-Braz-FAM2G]|uniref:peptidoglycan editing factor PgeF n=1 Tax=Polynucleobacter sp. MWH-Braz-FAM2G TaxID=1855883 RepID=UPI001BFD75C3|nr:peptidoglycan editing factor PgeF [Polynucleobacter sp. MWH-Braz-FAM2G]QWD91747.1 peptidoglycan editing factor PgeF [Polynucleobacter sp. MWH-Braz-FAM2G]
MSFILPQWSAPKSVHALVSIRIGGVSKAPFDSLNLGDHVGDSIENVLANRAIFSKNLPNEPLWLKQIHSTVVSTPQTRKLAQHSAIMADASVTNVPGEVLVVMTADCLPVLFTNSRGTAVGVAHAGWRGLCAGILENTISELLNISDDESAGNLRVWLGPAIGPERFEVGQDVVNAFEDFGIPFSKNAFQSIPNKEGKYLANIYQLARDRLESCGVTSISGGEFCTVQDSTHFFSYRRDGETGRFATAIWIAP